MYDFVAAQGPHRAGQAALVIPGCERYLAGCRSGVQIARVFERGQEFLAAWLRTRTAQRVDHRQCAGHSVKCQGLDRSAVHTSDLQSLMRLSYAVFCLKKTKHIT